MIGDEFESIDKWLYTRTVLLITAGGFIISDLIKEIIK